MTNTATTAPPIGIVGLPGLVSSLTQAGLAPVWDEHPPAAISVIQQHIATAGQFPVLVSGDVLDRISSWLPDLCALTHVVIVTPDPAVVSAQLTAPAHVAALPSSLGELLAAAGYSGIDPQLSALFIRVDATIAETTPGFATDLRDQLATAPADVQVGEVRDTEPHQAWDTAVPAALDADHVSTLHATGSGKSSAMYAALAAQEVAPAAPLPTAETTAGTTAAVEPELLARPATIIEAPVPSSGFDVLDAANQVMQMTGSGAVIAVWSGKGGVGKSTAAFSLAQRAGLAGLRTVLIDANLGQGDIRTLLRAGSSTLPSVYQAAATGDPATAFITADRINASRPVKLDPLAFAVVQAPPPHVPDPDLVVASTYRAVVAHARKHYDLVVIDTQIMESVDRNSMIGQFLVPLLLTPNAFGLGVCDASPTGIANMLSRLKFLAHQGVSRVQQLSMLNRVLRFSEAEVPGIGGALAEHSTFLGSVFNEDTIAAHVHRGRPASEVPHLSPILDAVLLRVTGNTEAFAAEETPADDAKAKKAKKDEAPADAADESPADTKKAKKDKPAKSLTSDSVFVNMFRR